MMPVSVCLWRLCIVVTECNGSRISLHAWIDACLCYLLTTSHPDRRMGWCQNFWWKRGGMEKLVIVAISLNLLTESLDPKQVTFLLLFTYEPCCERRWYLIWFYNLMHYIWRTVCARASHISCYARLLLLSQTQLQKNLMPQTWFSISFIVCCSTCNRFLFLNHFHILCTIFGNSVHGCLWLAGYDFTILFSVSNNNFIFSDSTLCDRLHVGVYVIFNFKNTERWTFWWTDHFSP